MFAHEYNFSSYLFIYFYTYLHIQGISLLWHNKVAIDRTVFYCNHIYTVVYFCWQNNALLRCEHSALYMTAFDTELTDLKCHFFRLFQAAFAVYTTFLVLAIMIVARFRLFSFLHPPLSWSSCVWSLNQPRQSGRTEENRLERRGGLRRWFCSASCITGEPSVPACCCTYGCEAMLS